MPPRMVKLHRCVGPGAPAQVCRPRCAGPGVPRCAGPGVPRCAGPGVPGQVCWPRCAGPGVYRPPTFARKAEQGPSSSLQDPKAQGRCVTCPKPLGIVSDKGAARIQGSRVLGPLTPPPVWQAPLWVPGMRGSGPWRAPGSDRALSSPERGALLRSLCLRELRLAAQPPAVHCSALWPRAVRKGVRIPPTEGCEAGALRPVAGFALVVSSESSMAPGSYLVPCGQAPDVLPLLL